MFYDLFNLFYECGVSNAIYYSDDIGTYPV